VHARHAASGASVGGRRIVFVNRFFHPDLSATSQILTDLARRLHDLGFEVHVVCSRLRYQSADERLPGDETVDGVRVHRVWSTGFGRSSLSSRALDYLSFYPAAMLEVGRLLRRGDIVVAKTDPPLLSVAVSPVARARSARLVNWLQDVFPEVAGGVHPAKLPGPVLDVLLWLRDRSLRRASMNVVLGPAMRDYLRRRHVPDARLRIVENWAASEPGIPQGSATSRLRAQLGFGDRFVVGYSGNLGRAHDHTTILRAASLLRNDPGVVFLLIGGGSGMREIEAGAREEGLGNLRFLPYRPREELSDSLAAADVHLVTLLPDAEGWVVPSKLYGVMAVGRPTVFVGAPTGDVARILNSADCGVTVPCGDADRLVAELMRLKNDPALRARLGANAGRAYRQNYTFDAAAERWVDLLQRVGG
jgi:glycosyltransferase involved in cell wall biosynthesis